MIIPNKEMYYFLKFENCRMVSWNSGSYSMLESLISSFKKWLGSINMKGFQRKAREKIVR